MKIVMLCDLYDERLQYQENLLAKYYSKHGHAVTVVASTFNSALDYYADAYDRRAGAREYVDGLAKVIKLPYQLNVLNKLRRFGGVNAILERERPDLIFVHGIHLNLSDAASYKRRNPSSRLIMDYHADYSNSAKNWLSLNILHKVIRRQFLHWHRRAIDKIYPVVPMSALFLNEVYGIALDEMDLLPLGADRDLARRTVDERSGHAIRAELAIPTNAVVIFTGGRLGPLKKTDRLVDAFLRLDNPRLHILVAGMAAAGHDDYVRGLRERCSGNRRVHFIGWVDGPDVYSYMHASDFAVFPASQSVMWQQAICMGLPLVVGGATSRGDQDPTYLNLYDNVVILSRAEVEGDALLEAICALASDDEVRERRRAGARRVAEELLDYDKIVAKTLTD